MRKLIVLALLALPVGCEWKPETACEVLLNSCASRCSLSVATGDLEPCYASCAQSYVVCRQGDNLCLCPERGEP